MVVFTEYRDTLQWLLKLLRQEGVAGDRVAILHGGVDADDREAIRQTFQADPTDAEATVRILLATDAASEGIDLHWHCHRLVNYDIPFNPNKLEQRIGRIDRYGQRERPEVRHFIDANWRDEADGFARDLEMLSRVARKVYQMEEDLGAVNVVLAEAVQRHLLGEHVDLESEINRPSRRDCKVVLPVMVPTGQVFNGQTVVFASDDPAMFALLSSAPHYWWAIGRASTMKGDLRYTPTDVFETFARPELTQEMRDLGARLDAYRRNLMLARNAGLTATYNLVHNARCVDADIVELRDIHRQIDEATVRAYGWNDLLDTGLEHGHHDTRQGPRWTVGPVIRHEILDRLLELNHERYAEEQRASTLF